jgi:hypothetical protein
MGRLVDQFCAACDEGLYQSPSGQSILLFILALIGGSPVIDPQLRLDPYLATVAHVHITLKRLIQGFKLSESSLVIGLIRAIEDVLEDCSVEPPRGTRHWSPATQRLIKQGLLVDSDGLTLVGDVGAPSLDQLKLARADLELWRELTAPILEEQNLERAICEEVMDE